MHNSRQAHTIPQVTETRSLLHYIRTRQQNLVARAFLSRANHHYPLPCPEQQQSRAPPPPSPLVPEEDLQAILNKLRKWRQLQNRESPLPLLLPLTDREEDHLLPMEEAEVEALLTEANLEETHQEGNLLPSSP